jgi:hypothetical protein
MEERKTDQVFENIPESYGARILFLLTLSVSALFHTQAMLTIVRTLLEGVGMVIRKHYRRWLTSIYEQDEGKTSPH